MGELGDQADQLHCDLAPHLSQAKVDRLFVVGKHMKQLADFVVVKFPDINVSYFNDKNALERALLHDIRGGDVVMVKGSNSGKMSSTVHKLKKLDLNREKQAVSN